MSKKRLLVISEDIPSIGNKKVKLNSSAATFSFTIFSLCPDLYQEIINKMEFESAISFLKTCKLFQGHVLKNPKFIEKTIKIKKFKEYMETTMDTSYDKFMKAYWTFDLDIIHFASQNTKMKDFQCMPSLLKNAALKNDKTMINYLIEKGNDHWNRGLLGACQGGHKDLVIFFLEKGADLLKICPGDHDLEFQKFYETLCVECAIRKIIVANNFCQKKFTFSFV